MSAPTHIMDASIQAMSTAELAALAASLNDELAARTQSRAAHAVFRTYELLEHILLRLSPKQLCLFRRVCGQWKAVISHSSVLRRQLFLQEPPRHKRMVFSVSRIGSNSKTEFLLKEYKSRQKIQIGEQLSIHAAFNSILCLKPQGLHALDTFTPTLEHQLKHGVRLPLSDLALEALRLPLNSTDQRLDMALTQPATAVVHVLFVAQGHGSRKATARNLNGLRLRHIIKAITPQFRHDPTLSVSILIPPGVSGFSPLLFPMLKEPRLAHLFGGPLSAVPRVFGVNELLEMILDFLTPNDAMVVQRVSKRWQEVIRTSPCIQRAAFMMPESPRMACKLIAVRDMAVARPQSHPDHFSVPVYKVMGSKKLAECAASSQPFLRIGQINKLICSLWRRDPADAKLDIRASFNPHIASIALNLDVLKAIGEDSEGTDSRLDMFLTQPPYNFVNLRVPNKTKGVTPQGRPILAFPFKIPVHRADGVRLRDLLAAAKKYGHKLCPEPMHEWIRLDLHARRTEHKHDLIFLSDQDKELLAEREREEAARLEEAAQRAKEVAAKVAATLGMKET